MNSDMEQRLIREQQFGLNFERHVPEAVELPGRPVRKGDKVHVLPPRGKTLKKADEKLWRVVALDRAAGKARLEAVVVDREGGEQLALARVEVGPESITAAIDDLVVVAGFRDAIYPGLVSTGKVERGGDKPFHTVSMYGVLADMDHADAFLKAVAKSENVRLAYVVTDEDRIFESVSQQLPAHVEPVRLCEAYLRNFEIESGRGVL